MSKRVLMVLQSEFPPDVRIEKEASALLEHGYEVHLLCNRYSDIRDSTEVYNNINVHRLPVISKNTKVNKLINIPFPGNVRWYKFIRKYVDQIKPDVIHVHDLPLMVTAIRIGRKYNIPVLYDRHEDYPEALRMWKQRGVIAKTIKHPSLIQKIENYSIRNADQIIVVIDEAKAKLESMGVPQEKVSVVSNTVDESDYIELQQQQDEGAITIVYTGTFSPSRGLETAVEGMTILKDLLPNSRMILVGDGADKSVKRNLEKYVRDNNLTDYVHFTGWATNETMWKYIRSATICIVPQPSHPFTDNTIPHKLFDYMLYGKPVVVSDAKPLKRIVQESNCGMVFTSRSAEDFARAVTECYKERENLGKNGREAVKKRYNWSYDAKNLLEVYNNIHNGAKSTIK